MPTPALPPPPDGRFLVAFDDPTLEWEPTWTRLDSTPNLVTSYTIDRGRQYELDRTDTGRAEVEIIDPDGILDPTNSSGPYYGKLEPLLQAMIGRRNPVTGIWHTRFRGWVEQFDYEYDPSQQYNRLRLSLVDIFEMLAAVEMQAGHFGNPRPADIKAQDVVWFSHATECRDRMIVALGDAKIPTEFQVLFSGNVALWPTSYSSGETVMDVLADAADAEFPGVGNIYTDRFGRFVFHGRLAKFTPEDIALDAGPGRWDWHTWDVGDQTAVHTDPANCSQIRRFAFDRGLAKVINSASVTPMWSPRSTDVAAGAGTTNLKDLTAAEINGQLVQDQASIDANGLRSWTAQNLQTESCNLPSAPADALQETRKMAQFFVDNYKTPRNRVTEIGFRSISTLREGAAITWRLLTELDISDGMSVTVDAPGGGGFALEPFFVEGVHEQCGMLTPDMDDVTMTVDLSPRAYYDSIPPGWLP